MKIITIADAIEMPISKNVGFWLKEIYYVGTYEQEEQELLTRAPYKEYI